MACLVHHISMPYRAWATRSRMSNFNVKRLRSSVLTRPSRILGIETSCDDTGAAVVDSDGNILGEALHSQTAVHVELVNHFYSGVRKMRLFVDMIIILKPCPNNPNAIQSQRT